MNRRLTVNLGLRYDIITASTERFNLYSNFNPTINNPLVNASGVLAYAEVNFGRQAHDTDYNNFGPRFGLAWDVGGAGRTIVRGGYGVFYFHNAINEYPETQGFSVVTTYPANAGHPAFQLHNGPPLILQPPGSSRGAASFLGDSVTFVERKRRTSYVQQWNFGVQRELPMRLLAEISYAGGRGVKLFTESYDFNQLDPRFLSLGNALNDKVPNWFFNVLPVGSPLRTATIPRRRALRPFPYFNNITVLNPHLGNTTYHSVQIKVDRRFANGLGFLFAFTGSKSIWVCRIPTFCRLLLARSPAAARRLIRAVFNWERNSTFDWRGAHAAFSCVPK